jgi:hypothetical protein
MVLVQKQNRTSRRLKLHVSVSQFFGTKRTHSRVPGLKGEALFLKLTSFWVCLPIIDQYKFVYTNLYYEFTHIDLHVIYLFIGEMNTHYIEN